MANTRDNRSVTMRSHCCVCEMGIKKSYFKVRLPAGFTKYICESCKQLLRVAFETTGIMKFTKGRLAGSK